jgi:alpha-beta hydrolase superfamily lysophospholipase
MVTGMKEEIFDLLSEDGTRLHLHSWQPLNTEMVVVVVHGMGGHSGYYRDSLAPYLTDQHVSVYAPDLRGHGKSDGIRGHTDTFSHFQKDVKAAVKFARLQHPGLPLILLGESMGTSIAINYVSSSKGLERPDGLILAACVIAPTVKPRITEVFRTCFYYVTNRQKIVIPITGREAEGIRDPAFVEVLKGDKAFTRKVSVRFLLEMTRHMNLAAKSHDLVDIPLLLMQGGKDITIKIRPTRSFFERISAKQKEMHIFPEAFHAILNDPDSHLVREVMLKWLGQQLEVFRQNRVEKLSV